MEDILSEFRRLDGLDLEERPRATAAINRKLSEREAERAANPLLHAGPGAWTPPESVLCCDGGGGTRVPTRSLPARPSSRELAAAAPFGRADEPDPEAARRASIKRQADAWRPPAQQGQRQDAAESDDPDEIRAERLKRQADAWKER